MYELKSDLLLGNAMSKIETRGKALKEWKPLFWPDDYMRGKRKDDIKVEDYTLGEE